MLRRLFYWLAVCAASLAAATAQPAAVTFDLRVERGRVPENMRRIRVEQGDVVTLRWSVDRATILHLHGYDIEKRAEPGAVTDMTFTARATGRFPVHVHDVGAQSADRAREQAPIVHVEVHPR